MKVYRLYCGLTSQDGKRRFNPEQAQDWATRTMAEEDILSATFYKGVRVLDDARQDILVIELYNQTPEVIERLAARLRAMFKQAVVMALMTEYVVGYCDKSGKLNWPSDRKGEPIPESDLPTEPPADMDDVEDTDNE